MDNLLYIFFIAITVWLAILTFYLYKTVNHYKSLTKGTVKENLTKILDKILEGLALDKKKTAELTDKLQQQIEASKYHVQRVGVLRFNPFADIGGNQSFVLAILDGTDSGIVLTSLHTRGATRWYAKNVKNGKGVDHQLSEEEGKAIREAVLLKSKEKT